MIVIPAVDIKDGRCVRLQQGEADRETVYEVDPVAAAVAFAAAGAARIHVVDLDGAFDGRLVNIELVRELIAAVEVPVEFGGGVRTRDAAETLFAAGAARVIVGTRAVERPAFFEELAREFPGRISLGLDAKDGQVAVRGWTQTGDVSASEVVQRVQDLPLGEIIYTDVARDGMLRGPNFAATETIARLSVHPVIAAGGVTSVSDIKRLTAAGIFGAIVGKALYDGRIDPAEAFASLREISA